MRANQMSTRMELPSWNMVLGSVASTPRLTRATMTRAALIGKLDQRMITIEGLAPLQPVHWTSSTPGGLGKVV